MSGRGTARERLGEPETWLAALLGVYFLARLLFFAFAIAPGVPPDEPTHVGLIAQWARAAPWIEDGPATHPYGLVTRVPFLYHLLLGKLSWLNLFGLEELLYLRLLNAALSVLTLALAWRLARRLSGEAPVRLLFLVMVTNTPIHTFLGAAVSYDNLVLLLAVLGLASLVGFLQRGRPPSLAAFLLWILLGSLTKLAFVPLGAILAGVLIFERRRHLGGDARALAAWLAGRRARGAALTALLAAGLVGNLWLYGGNLIRYRRPVPTCDQVLELAACMENRIFARGWILRQYREGATTFEQAVAATARIDHPGDRDHALRLLSNERAWQASRPRPLPPWDYVALIWQRGILPTLFGVQAHLSMLKDPWALLPYKVLLLAAFLLFVRHASWTGEERLWCHLALVVLLYLLVVAGYQNYGTYLTTHAPFLGVQGRYLLPVLVPAWLVVARSLLRPFGTRVRLAVLGLVAVLFVLGDLPWFLHHATPAWFTPPGAAPPAP